MAAHYGEIAERMHTESVTLNRRVTRWAGAALILGFAGAIIGVWPGSN
jgi:drug/metabolite transporter (DMT)-like permease